MRLEGFGKERGCAEILKNTKRRGYGRPTWFRERHSGSGLSSSGKKKR